MTEIINLIDKCKNCGCSQFECLRCNDREFYRHIDDKLKLKSNYKIIRKRGSFFNY